jgi:hypothetical protein
VSHRFLVAAVVCVTAGAALSSLAAADEPRRLIDMSRAFDAGAPNPNPLLAPIAPDPPPLVERSQWVYDFRWDRGDVWLLGVRRVELDSPRPTPRAMGRFALELYEGHALVERVRFDFPLLAVPDDEADAGWPHAPSLTGRLRTRVGVYFPATSRGTRLELWDRATGRRWSLPWPVATPPAPAAADGGVDLVP